MPTHRSASGLLTVGHGALDRARLRELLAGSGVDLVVDVRRHPGSRSNPDVAREALAGWLPASGIGYRWEERLGGRRHLPRDEPATDTWWTVPAFRAYAAHTRTTECRDALALLVDEARTRTVAIMCSESVWWRCHRRLIADVVALTQDLAVRHIMHGGSVMWHVPPAGAQVRADGCVVWVATRA